MAAHYLVAAGPRNRRLSVSAIARKNFPSLTRVASTDRFDVFVDDVRLVVPLGHSGMIIGDLFPRSGPLRRIARLAADTEAILQTGGQRLIERFWGNYIAVLSNGAGVRVIRDPSGSAPCCQLKRDGMFLFASDASLFVDLGLWDQQIDWSGLIRHLYTAGLPSSRTALQGIEEVLPGTAVTAVPNEVRLTQAWSPWDHVDQKHGTGSDIESLGSVIQATTSALASRHQRALIGVSGGLDSSIVAACLRATNTEMVCATAVTDEADGDERGYARILCSALGTELIEAHYAVADIDIERAAAPRLLRPTSRTQSQGYNAIMARIVADRSIDAFWTGNGGDNVFALSQSATSIYDRFLSEGVGAGMVRTLFDVCRLNGCSPVAALKAAIRIARAGSRRYNWRCEPLFLHRDIVAAEAEVPVCHAWLDAPRNALPGKAVHIAMLLRIQQHLQASSASIGVEVVTPLMAQPVMEACLAIPSWCWCSGGENRSVARKTFAPKLPSAIVERRTKGSPDSFSSKLIESNRTAILERLLEGKLAKAGILDRPSIESALVGDRQIEGQEHVELLTLIEAEAWLGYWLDRPD